MDDSQVPPSIPQAPSSPSPEVTLQSTKSSYHPHLIGFMVFLAVFILGFYFGTRKLNHSELPAPTISPTPAASVDPTANWKTYINARYNYSIKYPSDWKIINNLNGSISINSSDFQQNEKNFTEIEAKTGASLIIYEPIEGNPSLLEQTKGQIIKGNDLIEDKINTDIEEITVDGQKGILYTLHAVNSPSLKEFHAMFIKNGKVYSSTLTYFSEKYKDVYKKILSTFKFTE